MWRPVLRVQHLFRGHTEAIASRSRRRIAVRPSCGATSNATPSEAALAGPRGLQNTLITRPARPFQRPLVRPEVARSLTGNSCLWVLR